MRRLRPLAAASVALGILVATALPAHADNVQNDISAVGDDTFVAGASTSVGYRIASNNGDGESGCNATAASPTTVTVVVPSGVSVSPTSRTFTSCGGFQQVTFSSSTPGDYPITVSVSDSGPGTWNTNPASFTLHVTAPPDTTAPVITKTVTGTAGTNGWYTSNVTVAWSVTDAQSPVVIDTGCGTQVFSSETAAATSTCAAHSAGGSASDSFDLKIDKTGPSAVLSPSGDLGQNDWFTSNVTVSTNGVDALSGPVTCAGDQLLTAETAGTTVNGSCTNDAGLSTNAAPIVVKIDKTGPSAVLSPSGTGGANGWFTSDVTVSTDGVDALSGPVTCTDDQLLTTETAGTTVNGSCTNAAGLSMNANPLVVKIDKTNPSAALVVTAGTLGDNGWYKTAVTVDTQGADTVSDPVDCTDPQTFSDDTTGVTVDGSCTNDAGLTQNATSLVLKIDATAPTNVVLSASGTAGTNGWYTDDVTVSTTGEDATSGVTCTTDQLVDYETASVTLNGSCTNGAGLTTNAAPLTVKIDKTAPTASIDVTAGTLGSNGWYTTAVTATATGADTISTPVTCLPATHTQSTDTTGMTLASTCTNDAGLSTPASLNVKVDQTAPTGIAFTGGPADGGSYYFGSVPAAPSGCTATDTTSGLEGCDVTGYGAGVGVHTMTATARDNAGNESTATRTYTVKAWEKSGFYQPVDMNGVLNIVKNGSTVPLKFEAFAGNTELTDAAIVDRFIVQGIACPNASTIADDIELTSTGGTALRYDASGGQFIQNWQTPKKSGACYRVILLFDDGGTIAADFKLK